jgi:hypothetical protein
MCSLTVHLLQCLHMHLAVVLMPKAMLSIHVHVAIMLGAIVVSHDVAADHEIGWVNRLSVASIIVRRRRGTVVDIQSVMGRHSVRDGWVSTEVKYPVLWVNPSGACLQWVLAVA